MSPYNMALIIVNQLAAVGRSDRVEKPPYVTGWRMTEKGLGHLRTRFFSLGTTSPLSGHRNRRHGKITHSYWGCRGAQPKGLI